MEAPEPAPTASDDGTLRKQLNWAASKSIGGVTEIAVLTPVKKGAVPLERRSYEERLVAVIDNLADRHRRGLPTELAKIPVIHFGRMIIIRPEQYLLHSNVQGVQYYPDSNRKMQPGARVPRPIDDYMAGDSMKQAGELRTFLLTLVEFDGDLKVYMRDIAKILGTDFEIGRAHV